MTPTMGGPLEHPDPETDLGGAAVDDAEREPGALGRAAAAIARALGTKEQRAETSHLAEELDGPSLLGNDEPEPEESTLATLLQDLGTQIVEGVNHLLNDREGMGAGGRGPGWITVAAIIFTAQLVAILMMLVAIKAIGQ